MSRAKTFKKVLAEAIAALNRSPPPTPETVAHWTMALHEAAERELGTDYQIEAQARAKLGRVYDNFIRGQRLRRVVPGVTPFGVSIVRPQARAELDRRVAADVGLIRLNKRAATARTEARLTGWVTSIPPGGSSDETLREVRRAVGKPIEQAAFERRRVDIDQSHKLIANVAEIVAVGNGAIAGEWHDHGEHDRSYDFREDHMDRAGKIYVYRDSWAARQGLLVAVHGYTDEITAPAQEPFCRCFYRFITSPRRLPPEYVSARGREWLDRGARAAQGMGFAA